MDISRIVFETDSPYLSARPTTLIAITEEVGRLKKISLKVLPEGTLIVFTTDIFFLSFVNHFDVF